MNDVLKETVEIIKNRLGDELDEITVERAVLGVFFTGVKLSTGEGGLCVTPVKMMPEAVCCPSSARLMPNPGSLKNRPVTEYLEFLTQDSILRKTLGIAAVNALTNHMAKKGLITDEIEFGKDAFDEIPLEKGKHAVVVGALIPIIKKLKNNDMDYTILEQDKRTLKGDELLHFRPAEDFKEVLPEADIVYITGTTILNDTITGLLDVIDEKARVVVAGPTVSLVKEPLFERGVDIIGGDYVKDPDEMLEVLSEAGSGYHLFGKSCERIVIKK